MILTHGINDTTERIIVNGMLGYLSVAEDASLTALVSAKPQKEIARRVEFLYTTPQSHSIFEGDSIP
jgi:hypothetical protein